MNYGLMVTLHDMTTQCCGTWVLFLNADGIYRCRCGNDFNILGKLAAGKTLTEEEERQLSAALSNTNSKDGDR